MNLRNALTKGSFPQYWNMVATSFDIAAQTLLFEQRLAECFTLLPPRAARSSTVGTAVWRLVRWGRHGKLARLLPTAAELPRRRKLQGAG